MPEAVDLEEDDTGDFRLDGALLPHLPLDDAPVEDRVVVDREDGGHDHGDHGQERRQQDALPDAIDVEALVDHPRREPDEGAVQRERAEPHRPSGDRERKADEERPDERVEQTEDRRGQERHTQAAERDPGTISEPIPSPIALITKVTSARLTR